MTPFSISTEEKVIISCIHICISMSAILGYLTRNLNNIEVFIYFPLT